MALELFSDHLLDHLHFQLFFLSFVLQLLTLSLKTIQVLLDFCLFVVCNVNLLSLHILHSFTFLKFLKNIRP